jgi:beta-galactosidase/beta-glucuronidase
MLVWQDMVNGGEEYNVWLVGNIPTIFPWITGLINDRHYKMFGRKSAEGRDEWIRECEDTVTHLYNSPSIVAWVPFNEAWGQFDARKAYERIRELDPTRLIDHASGWYDQKCGDFKSVHNYFHPFRVKSGQRPYVLSEFGGYACYTTEHSYSLQIYGYRIYLTQDELDQAYKNLMEKDIKDLISNGLSASVYTQLTDVEDEVNGLLTYDRKVCKVSPVHLPAKL